MTAKRYFVTCEVGNVICELISRKLSDDEFEHLTYYDIVNRLNELSEENEQLKEWVNELQYANETQAYSYKQITEVLENGGVLLTKKQLLEIISDVDD